MSRWCSKCVNKKYPSCDENCIIFGKRFEELAELCFDLQLKQSQWIPCRERLPLEEGVYIVSCVNHNHNGREFVSGDYFYTSESNTEGGFFDAFGADVIAWQPLPPAYREVENE